MRQIDHGLPTGNGQDCKYPLADFAFLETRFNGQTVLQHLRTTLYKTAQLHLMQDERNKSDESLSPVSSKPCRENGQGEEERRDWDS